MVNFLDVEKLERGQSFYNHDQIVNLTKVLKTTILLFREIAENKRIKIVEEISEKDIFIKIDPYAIDRVINNILDNAIRYTETGGEIIISLNNNNEDKVELSVNDTGTGISEKKLEHIFESYYQISHKKRNIEGIGVGLSIVKKIVDQVDGEIKIESKTNVGTSFNILFKNYELSDNDIIENNLEYTKPIKIASFEKLEEERYEEGKYNILIVEDNIHLLAYLQNSIKSKYNVYYAGNGEDALRKLEYIPKPNIIISDILMDIMDGYDFYNVLSDNERYKDIPVIFLTAKTSLDEKVEGLSKGAVDYIYKPFHINELLAKINSIIRSQEVTREVNITEMENKILEETSPYQQQITEALTRKDGLGALQAFDGLVAKHNKFSERFKQYLDSGEDTLDSGYLGERVYKNLSDIQKRQLSANLQNYILKTQSKLNNELAIAQRLTEERGINENND